jgi:hypothetical protein
VEILRRTFSAYNTGFLTGDTSPFLELVAPDVEWHSATEVLDPLYLGKDGVQR